MLLSQTEPAVAGNMAAAGCDSHSEDDIHCTNSVHTLNQRPVLHPVYLKYSETEYWAENKTDSIPDTGYSLKPDCEVSQMIFQEDLCSQNLWFFCGIDSYNGWEGWG